MAWNVVDRYKMDPTGTSDNAALIAHLAADLGSYYTANKPLPKVVFPEGIFSFSAWPNLAYPGLQIVGDGMAILKHIGAGDAITFDGLAITQNPGWNGTNHMDIGPFYIVPNQKSGNGFVLRSWHRSRVQARVMGTGVPPTDGSMYAAVNVLFSVCGELHVNVPAYLAIPSIQPSSFNCIGLRLSNIAGSAYNSNSTGCYVPNPVCEGVTIGIMLDNANGNHFYGGVCEECHVGLQLQHNSEFNEFEKIDLEGNTTSDIIVDGSCRGNTFSIPSSPTSIKTNIQGWDNVLEYRLADALPI